MKKIICLLVICLFISGCSKVQESVNNQKEDEIIVNSNSSHYYNMLVQKIGTDTREIYNSVFSGNQEEYLEVGRSLERICLDYFSTDTYLMQKSDHLKYYVGDQANGDYFKMMVRPEKSDYSIQPSADAVVDGVSNCRLFESMYAIDFYKKANNGYELGGMAISAVINSDYVDNDTGITYTYSDETIETYAKNAISTIYKYYTQGSDYTNLMSQPILIAIYKKANSKDKLSGEYIYYSYCNQALGEIKSVNSDRVYFISEKANQIDSTTYNEFLQFKNNLKQHSVEAIGVIGEGRYYNGKLENLQITINANCKVYDELRVITQYTASLLDEIFTTEAQIIVKINNSSAMRGLVIKENGKTMFYLL